MPSQKLRPVQKSAPGLLVVRASDSLTRGPGSIPGWVPIKHCFFFLLLFQLYNNELLPTSNIN